MGFLSWFAQGPSSSERSFLGQKSHPPRLAPASKLCSSPGKALALTSHSAHPRERVASPRAQSSVVSPFAAKSKHLLARMIHSTPNIAALSVVTS